MKENNARDLCWTCKKTDLSLTTLINKRQNWIHACHQTGLPCGGLPVQKNSWQHTALFHQQIRLWVYTTQSLSFKPLSVFVQESHYVHDINTFRELAQHHHSLNKLKRVRNLLPVLNEEINNGCQLCLFLAPFLSLPLILPTWRASK